MLSFGGLSPWCSATSQDSYGDIPPHARIATGSQGWLCDPTYRQVGDACVADPDRMLDRQRFEVFQNGWRCIPGYRLSTEGYCVRFFVPPHAVAVNASGQWECEPGFVRSDSSESRCDPIIVPPHAHLDPSGRSWRCDGGFRFLSRVCIPLTPGAGGSEDPESSDAAAVGR